MNAVTSGVWIADVDEVETRFETSHEVGAYLSDREQAPHPTAECMEKSRAFAAMRDFLSHGARPIWLTYRYVP